MVLPPIAIIRWYYKTKEQILGQEFSGEMIGLGKNVIEYKIGDQIYGPCFFDAYAEYMCLKSSSSLSVKPKNASFEESATIPVGGINAFDFL